MAWLRVDDGFSRHPKVTALNHRDRWVWLDLLCWCARYSREGWLPSNIRELVPGTSDALIEKCLHLGLIDDVGGEGLRVHDWESYSPKDPTGAERQAKWRKAQRHGNRNGARNSGITADVTDETVTETVTEPSTSRVGARARSRPVLEDLSKAVPVARHAEPEPEPDIHGALPASERTASDFREGEPPMPNLRAIP